MRLKTGAKTAGVFVAAGALAALLGTWHTVYAPLEPLGNSAEEDRTVSVIFGGDIMLDRNVYKWRKEEPESIFAGVESVFARADYRVANLEGTITTNPSIAQRDNTVLRFTFDPTFARAALAPLALDAVSLANNHALDFGVAGYDSTRAHLAEWGVAPFGHPYDTAEFISTTIQTPLGALCLVGYHSLYDPDTSSVLAEIARLRGHEPQCFRVVVFAHWGEEYRTLPEDATRRIARRFIDAGADHVIGAHPHVVQPHEVYGGGAIFYSLGNFAFDQQFSPEVMQGLLVEATFGMDKDCFTPIPTAIATAAVVALEPLDTFCLP